MKRYARLSTAIIFGVVTLLVTAILLLSYKLPDSGTFKLPNPNISFWAQVPSTLAFEVLWPPVLAAILLGAASGSLFAKTTSKRLGVFYAACLGILISLPLSFVATLSQLKLDNFAFALTFTTFDKPATILPVGIYVSSEGNATVNTLFAWLPGPLTGVLVWAWLRVSQRL